MTATNYERGRAFEYRVMARLREAGFTFVARTAGSHSPVDVVAGRDGEVWCVQCKRDGRLSAKDHVALVGAADASGAVAVVAEPAGRGTIEFARLLDGGGWVLLDVDSRASVLPGCCAPDAPDDLAEIVRAWPMLPQAIKDAVLAVVLAAGVPLHTQGAWSAETEHKGNE